MSGGILVFAEQRSRVLKKGALEVISQARRMTGTSMPRLYHEPCARPNKIRP